MKTKQHCRHGKAAGLEFAAQVSATTVNIPFLPQVELEKMHLDRPQASDNVAVTPTLQSNDFYNINSRRVLANKPWRTEPHYFQRVHISLLALVKMTTHAISGGPIEIMGMLTGFYRDNDLIILDCYQLPVVGTESRVNPQNDSYEFMLQYLTSQQKGVNRKENIIGWYHSHPGFGCWLSGIDVQTQKLQQGFEDPYVALVVDPVNTLKTGTIDIGAFRTYYDGYEEDDGDKSLGYHSKDYYSLIVNIFANEFDMKVINQIGCDAKGASALPHPDNSVDLSGLQRMLDQFCGKTKLFQQRDHVVIDKHTLLSASTEDTDNTNINDETRKTLVEFQRASTALSEMAKEDLNSYIAMSIRDELFR